MNEVALCSVVSASTACATSAIINFLIPGLDGHHFVAWGANDGIVYVGAFQVPRSGSHNGQDLENVGNSSFRHLLAIEISSGGQASNAPIAHVAFGGGPHVLLAASTRHCLTVFSLESLIDSIYRADSVAAVTGAVGSLHFGNLLQSSGTGSGALLVVGTVNYDLPKDLAPPKILGISWTQQLDGILVSDSGGTLTMWEILAEDEVASPSGRSASIIRAWRTVSPEPQDLISAGVCIDTPSASACSFGERCGHIYWPEDAAPDSFARYSVRVEKLKHPCELLGLEWCPGVLRKDILNSTDPLASIIEDATPSGDASRPSSPTPPEDHPALMTLGTDGGIRIWVEMLVVHHPAALSPSQVESDAGEPPSTTATVPTLDSYFAMALVIDPPSKSAFDEDNNVNSKALVKSVRWANGAGTLRGRAVKHASSRVLWLICMETRSDGVATLYVYAVRGLSPVVVASYPGSMTGASSLTTGAKRPQAVLWGQHSWPGAFPVHRDAREEEGSFDVLNQTSAFSAWLAASDDFPGITCFHSQCQLPSSGNILWRLFARGITYSTTVQAESVVTTPTTLHQGLLPISRWKGLCLAHARPVTAVALHYRHASDGIPPMIASLDASGSLGFWRVEPEGNLEGYPILTRTKHDMLPHAEETGSYLAWVQGQPSSSTGSLAGQSLLAVAVGNSLTLHSISHEAGGQPITSVIASSTVDDRITGIHSLSAEWGGTLTTVLFVVLGTSLPVAFECSWGDGIDSTIELIPLGPVHAPFLVENEEHSRGCRIVASAALPGVPGGLMLGTESGDAIPIALEYGQQSVVCFQLSSPVHLFSNDGVRTIAVDGSCGMSAALSAKNSQLVVWQTEYSLERSLVTHPKITSIELEAQATAVGWVPGMVVPCVAVGGHDGSVALYGWARRGHTLSSRWRRVAMLPSQPGTGPVTAFANMPGDALLAAMGSRLLSLSDTIDVAGLEKYLSKYLVELSGPLPQYHPSFLRSLLLSGRRNAAVDVLQALASWLTQRTGDNKARSVENVSAFKEEGTDELGASLGVSAIWDAQYDNATSHSSYFPAVPLAAFLDHEYTKIVERLRQSTHCGVNGKPEYSEIQETTLVPQEGQPAPSLETGMLDLAAFGMDSFPSAHEAPSAAPAASIESGMLDLASFGLGGDMAPGVGFESSGGTNQSTLAESDYGQRAKAPTPLEPPRQLQVPAAALSPVPKSTVLALQRAARLVPEESNEGNEDEGFYGTMKGSRLGPAADIVDTGILDVSALLAKQPLIEAFPGLTEAETAEIVLIATSLCEGAGPRNSLPVDTAGANFITALTLGSILQHGATLSSDSKSQHGAAYRSTSSNSTVRNAAGVQYTLLPSSAESGQTPFSPSEAPELLGLTPELHPSIVFWALLSGCPEGLLEYSTQRFAVGDTHKAGDSGAGRVTWPMLRAAGAGIWLRDKRLLASTAELLAKAQYASRRNPDDAALWYAALRKKSVLQGLYRMAQRTREADFLARDFNQAKHKDAACKNAFVLLGQHRYELAAAFFVFGGNAMEAVSVCANELGDVQLALVVARLLDNTSLSDSERAFPALERCVVETHLLPAARRLSNWNSMWISALAAWLLGSRHGCIATMLEILGDLESSSTITAEILPSLIPMLDIVAKSTGGGSPDSEQVASIHFDGDSLQDTLLRWCTDCSETLSMSGLPALALDFEAVTGGSCNVEGKASHRVAYIVAAALLPQPLGSLAEDAPRPEGAGHYAVYGFKKEAIDKQLTALRACDVIVDRSIVLRRLVALHKAVSRRPSWGAYRHLDPHDALLSPRTTHSSMFFGRENSMEARSVRSTLSTSSVAGMTVTEEGVITKMARPPCPSASVASLHPGVPNKGPLNPGLIIFQVDSDAVVALAACPLVSPDVLGRPIVAATTRHGLLEFAAQPLRSLPNTPRLEASTSEFGITSVPEDVTAQQALGSSDVGTARSDPQQPSVVSTAPPASVFSRMLSQIFDQTSWALDPYEERSHSAVDGDLGLSVALSMAKGTPHSASGDVSSPYAVRAMALAAHPFRQLFLSGCAASGRVQLWQFGGPRPLSLFTPVAPTDLNAVQADMGFFSFSARQLTRSTSLVRRMGNWGGARGLAFSPIGERFAAVGDGGVVATWRLGGGSNRQKDTDGALCAEWWHHCLTREGRAVAYIGGSASVLAAGGKCTAGNISLWDASSPPPDACVGRLTHHSATVAALATLPGGWLLAAADIDGALSLSDVRMIGGRSGGARVLWKIRAAKGPVQALASLPLAGSSERPRALALGAACGGGVALVTGGQDGVVRVWQASSGKLIQSLAACSPNQQKLSRVFGGGGGPAGVTGLVVCEEGVVSCGGDGVVKLFSLKATEDDVGYAQ